MLRINWVTAALASATLWGFIIWVLADEGGSKREVTLWKKWITSNFGRGCTSPRKTSGSSSSCTFWVQSIKTSSSGETMKNPPSAITNGSP